MPELIHKVAESEGSGVVLTIGALIVGVVLWAAGRRMLRTAFGAAGLLIGAGAGVAIAQWPVVASTGAPEWVIILVMALLLAVVCAAAYRLTLAAAIGVLLASIAPVGVLAAVERGWMHLPEGETLGPAPTAEEILAMPAPPSMTEGEQEDGSTAVESTAAEDLPRWRQWGVDAWDAVVAAPKRAWEMSDETLRWTMVAASGSGLVAGLMLGAAAPSLAASLVTSLFGSLLLLGSGCTLAVKLNVPDRFLPHDTLQWLLWWAVAAVIGLGLQWTLRPKPADT